MGVSTDPFLLEADSGVVGERPERRQQGRPEICSEIGAQGSDSDESGAARQFCRSRAALGPSKSVSSTKLAPRKRLSSGSEP